MLQNSFQPYQSIVFLLSIAPNNKRHCAFVKRNTDFEINAKWQVMRGQRNETLEICRDIISKIEHLWSNEYSNGYL